MSPQEPRPLAWSRTQTASGPQPWAPSSRTSTPPGYDRSGTPLPVLCLYHGALDTLYSWVTEERLLQILDNLLAQGNAVPMTVELVINVKTAQKLVVTVPLELLDRANQVID